MARSPQDIQVLQMIYIVAIIAWIYLVWTFVLPWTDVLGYLILAIPIFLFLLGYAFASVITEEVEENVFGGNYLAVGLLVILPLLTWVNRDHCTGCSSAHHFTSILVLALILTLASLIDVWLPPQWLFIMRHVHSILVTMALALLMYAFYEYSVRYPMRILR